MQTDFRGFLIGLPLAFTFGLALLPGFFLLPDTLLSRGPSRAEVIERGLRFYTEKNTALLRVDDAFLYQLIERSSHRYGPTFNLPAGIAERFADDPYRRLLNPENPVSDIIFYRRAYPFQKLSTIENNSYLVDSPYAAFLRDPYDDILFKALYCDVTGYDAGDFAILQSIGNGSGDYADTHLLLGLLLLHENNCFDTGATASAIEDTSAHIVRAAQIDRQFSDLYAERIVFLYWAGLGNRVRRSWVELVQQNLTNEPGWREAGHETANGHTTGLALLSLIYFEDGKKQQPFYSRTGLEVLPPLENVFSGGNVFPTAP